MTTLELTRPQIRARAASATPAWPRKTRELHNHHMDSTVWNDFRFRDDDIVVAHLRQVRHDLDAADRGPARFPRLTGRRRGRPLALARPAGAAQGGQAAGRGPGAPPLLKTHLPVDALVFSPQAKYIYIGRDGRDVVWSMYNHHANANDEWYAA